MKRMMAWVAVMATIAATLVVLMALDADAAPIAAGHRATTGVRGYADQSLKAIGYVARYGGQVVEGDVRATADDYLVMAHDDRAPGCSGTISGRTFASLRTCANSTVLPQLLFWLREAKRLGLKANVELKTPPSPHQVAVFARTIKAEAPSYTVLASFHPETLAAVKPALGSRVKYAPIIAPSGSPFGYSVSKHAAQFDIIMPDFRWMTVARMKQYRDAGVAVWLWTANTSEDITRCKALANAAPKTAVIIANDIRKVTGK